MNLLILLVLVGCGNSKKEDFSEYNEGIKVVDLLNEETYEKNGKKMVKAVEEAITSSPEDFHMVKCNAKFMSKEIYFEETFSENEKDFYYIGGMKKNKPHGFGVLTNGNNNDMEILYIGEFKKGSVKNCYGMELEYNIYLSLGTYVSVLYEGEFDSIDIEYLRPIISDGKRTIPYDFFQIYNYWSYEKASNSTYTPKGLDVYPYNVKKLTTFKVARCLPWYIGKVKNELRSGVGTSYHINGNVWYEGEFKSDEYHGKGKMYSESGYLLKDGKFKRGEFVEGKTYQEPENY